MTNELYNIRYQIDQLCKKPGWQDDPEVSALIQRRDELVAAEKAPAPTGYQTWWADTDQAMRG